MPHQSTGRGPAVVALAAALSLGLVACGGGGGGGSTAATTPCPSPAGTPESGTVSMVNDPSTVGAYQPKAITVPVCAAVMWTNDSDTPHTVTFTSSKVKSSGTFSKGSSFITTLSRVGT